MLKTIKYTITNGLVGCAIKGSFEVEDTATEADIDEMVLDEVWNRIDYHWEVSE